MPSAILALSLFALWTLLLVLGIAGWRAGLVLMGKERANGFKSGEEHGGPFYWRLNRAHLNCVETLAPFAALVLGSLAAGHEGALVTNCAWIVTGARLGQTAAHLSSGRSLAVNVRFTFFLAQLVALAVLGLSLALKLAGGTSP